MINRADVLDSLTHLVLKLRDGCLSHNCVVAKDKSGMRHNGLCRCDPRRIRQSLVDLTLALTDQYRWPEKEE